jgi:hypothetical protein
MKFISVVEFLIFSGMVTTVGWLSHPSSKPSSSFPSSRAEAKKPSS